MRLTKVPARLLVLFALCCLVGSAAWVHFDAGNFLPYAAGLVSFSTLYAAQFAVARIEAWDEIRNSNALAQFQEVYDKLGSDYDKLEVAYGELLADYCAAKQCVGDWQLYAEQLRARLDQWRTTYGDMNPTHAYLHHAHALVIRLMRYPAIQRRLRAEGKAAPTLDGNFWRLAQALIEAAIAAERIRSGVKHPQTKEYELALQLYTALRDSEAPEADAALAPPTQRALRSE